MGDLLNCMTMLIYPMQLLLQTLEVEWVHIEKPPNYSDKISRTFTFYQTTELTVLSYTVDILQITWSSFENIAANENTAGDQLLLRVKQRVVTIDGAYFEGMLKFMPCV